MAFEVPPLPYDYNALEPHIDEETMRLHHDKHHQAYVDKANAALEGTDWAHESVEHVLSILDTLPEDKQTVLRNNAGGHANHSLFWEIMSPDGGGEPEGELGDAINGTFGSLDELKKAVNDGGVNRFGSGWSWLVHDGTGLAVYSTANQDSPIMQSDEPLLGIDVWEHAYYLKYQNRRPDYLEAWWNVVNWPAVGERYAKAIGKVSARPKSALGAPNEPLPEPGFAGRETHVRRETDRSAPPAAGSGNNRPPLRSKGGGSWGNQGFTRTRGKQSEAETPRGPRPRRLDCPSPNGAGS